MAASQRGRLGDVGAVWTLGTLCQWRPRVCCPRQRLTRNIADSGVLNEVSQIVSKIHVVLVIGTTLFQFSLEIAPDSRFVLLGLIGGVLSLLPMLKWQQQRQLNSNRVESFELLQGRSNLLKSQ